MQQDVQCVVKVKPELTQTVRRRPLYIVVCAGTDLAIP